MDGIDAYRQALGAAGLRKIGIDPHFDCVWGTDSADLGGEVPMAKLPEVGAVYAVQVGGVLPFIFGISSFDGEDVFE
jgi:hypothetical protein